MAVLLQDQVAGLQVEGEDGWIDAPPVPGTFIVNVGEILEIASDGYLRANVHRVVSPPAGEDRLSVAFFLGARLDSEVPVARLAAASGGRGARRDAGPAQSALPRSRPQLPQGPAAVASRRRAPPSRRPARAFRRQARTRLGLLTPILPILQETRLHDDRQQALRDARPARRILPRRSGQRLGRGADLSDDLLPVPGHRPRLAALRARGARQHLHPRPEPDLGRARAARRRARRRRGGARGRLGADGLGLFGAQPRPGRRQHRLLDRPLRRHLDAVRADAEAVRHRDALRRSERPGEFPPRDRRQDPRLLRRDPAQSEAQRLPDPRSRRHRPLARRAADRRQHRDAADRAAARARRGGRRLFRHQVHRRPRQLDRRPDRRRRQFPVGAARRPLPAAVPARRRLSRRDLDRGRQAARTDRLFAARPRQASARHRRGAVAVQRLPAAAGARDPAAASPAAQRERHRGRELPEGPRRRLARHLPRPADRRVAPPRRRLSQGRLRRPRSASS